MSFKDPKDAVLLLVIIISAELFIPVFAVLRTCKDSNSERYFDSKSILLLLSAVKYHL